MPATYYEGELVRVRAIFKTQAGVLIDPNIVNLSHRDPFPTTRILVYLTDVEVIRDSEGNYHVDIDANLPGLWTYRWWSTGLGQAAVERTFNVTAAVAV